MRLKAGTSTVWPRRLSSLRKPAGIGMLVVGGAGGLAWYLIDFPTTEAAGRSRLAAAILLVAGVGGGFYLLMGKKAGAAVGGVLVAAIGVVLALVQFQLPNAAPNAVPSPTATTPVVGMSIEKPANNGTVEMLDDVQIRIKGAPERQVWLLVRYASGTTVFPQGPCDNPAAELSVCHKMQFGNKSDHAGTGFKVTAVIINPADADGYKTYYTNGFPQGPPPVKQLASSQTITVRRR